jgi:hypothetical protein
MKNAEQLSLFRIQYHLAEGLIRILLRNHNALAV